MVDEVNVCTAVYKSLTKREHAQLQDLVKEISGVWITYTEWKSKYNSYVVYDYEPFCSDGFDLNVTCQSNCSAKLDFIRYMILKKSNELDFLDNCLKQNIPEPVLA